MVPPSGQCNCKRPPRRKRELSVEIRPGAALSSQPLGILTRRVLRTGGELLFVEHGRAPDRGVARWQDWLDPVWKPVAGGCHLNRPIAEMIAEAGFRFIDLRTGYAGRPRTFKFMYEGAARPA